MLRKKLSRSRTFLADQEGVDKLKDEFFDEARDFVYFRKGEWHGILASIEKAASWSQSHPEWVSVAIAMYVPAKDLILEICKATGALSKKVREYFTNSRNNTVTRRVICGKSVGKREIAKWELICGQGGVVTIPKGQIGQFRFLVNEKRYAIFSRLGPDTLQGIIGTDIQIIKMLRERFDFEFIEADLRNNLRRNKRAIQSRSKNLSK
jgi:hypothetical protein